MGNSWFEIQVTSDYVDPGQPEPTPEGPQLGGETFTHIGGPIDEKVPVEFSFGAAVQVEFRPFEASVTGVAPLVRKAEFSVPARTSAVRSVEFSAHGLREPAYMWSRALKDDDEILEVLLTG